MHTVALRQVGGSTMLAIPPALLNTLNFGTTVNLSTNNGKLIIENAKPRYTLDELLAECNPSAPIDDELNDWLNSPAVGQELI